MNFAASVDDDNPRYFDDTREGGVIAPPLMATALTWPIYVNRHEYWGINEWPEEVVARQVHYTEALLFHRPIRPGDRLQIRGQIYAVSPHRGGSLSVVRYEAVDAAGDPVFTEYGGALFRGVRCADEGRRAGDLYETPPCPESNGRLWDAPVFIHALAAHIYDGCTDLSFPIHTSKRFAREMGLPDPILQGTATLAIAARELVNREADGDPTRLRALGCKFRAMVALGTTVEVVLSAKQRSERGTELFFEVVNHEGNKAISDGHALIED